MGEFQHQPACGEITYLGKQFGLWSDLLFDLPFEELPQWHSPQTSLRQLCRARGQLHQTASSEILLRVELVFVGCFIASLDRAGKISMAG